jgi:hypothetical protein
MATISAPQGLGLPSPATHHRLSSGVAGTMLPIIRGRQGRRFGFIELRLNSHGETKKRTAKSGGATRERDFLRSTTRDASRHIIPMAGTRREPSQRDSQPNARLTSAEEI